MNAPDRGIATGQAREVLQVTAELKPVVASPSGGTWQEAIRIHANQRSIPDSEVTLQTEAIRLASEKYGIHAGLLVAICISENCSQRYAHNPNGENSHGSFQYNIFGARFGYTHESMLWTDCANDYVCSADLTAKRIVEQYCVNEKWENGVPSGWIKCLSQHNGNVPLPFYPPKVEKNGLLSGLTY